MAPSEQTQAILLLTTWLGKPGSGDPAPLTPTEWGRFALYLVDIGRKPADLLHVHDLGPLLSSLSDKKVTVSRVSKLLKRSAALAIAMERWERAGLWVMTRSDPAYPRRWKQRLKNDAPPVLFGAGNKDLLNRGGLAVVGSRDLDESQIELASNLGRMAASEGRVVISGGARGADEAAMLGALTSEGSATGVLADSLLRTCTSSKYRKALMRNDLALVSPFNPEAGFNVGNAMARNKYIYCLSDGAVVVAATKDKGGTWSGAVENLKHKWVQVWVAKNKSSGNKALVEAGAKWLPVEVSIGKILDSQQPLGVSENAVQGAPPIPAISGDVLPKQEADEIESLPAPTIPGDLTPSTLEVREPAPKETPYEFFLHRLRSHLAEGPMSTRELQGTMLLKQKQLSEWLKQAEVDGVVVKTKTPVKYRLCDEAEQCIPTNRPANPRSMFSESDDEPGQQSGFEF
jgi:predicted Rossmann fold nucleotide-binding protein DprA/Smf involved in DNA uptake